MTATAIMSPCPGCGQEVQRAAIPEGTPFAGTLARIQVWCQACVDRSERTEQAAATSAEIRRHTVNSGVPPALLRSLPSMTFSAKVRDAAAEWAQGGGCLVLTGPVGTGKTTIAALAASLLLEAGRRVRWTSAPALLANLSRAFDDVERVGVLDVLVGRTPLVLDDLDKVVPSQYAASQLFQAIDQRIAYGAGLLITANLTVNEMADRWPEPLGDAIASRLTAGKVMTVGGKDRRLTS